MITRVKNALVALIVAGMVYAILRQFDWDPFAAVGWVISWIWETIISIADLFSSSDTFKEATKKPSE